jgi:hypothetical protein
VVLASNNKLSKDVLFGYVYHTTYLASTPPIALFRWHRGRCCYLPDSAHCPVLRSGSSDPIIHQYIIIVLQYFKHAATVVVVVELGVETDIIVAAVVVVVEVVL